MEYTIKQISEMTGISVSALRFYDKSGLLPFVQRKKSGYRIFTELDLSSLQLVKCLKETGMSIDDIKKFSDWIRQGDSTLQQRYEMFVERKAAVEKQIEELKKSLDVIEYKKNYYETALKRGSEDGMRGKDKLPHVEDFFNYSAM